MRRQHLLALVFLCPVPTIAAQTDSVPPRVWVDAFTEGPTFCLILSQDGSARFTPGFTTYNPLRWRYDSVTATLSLIAPRLTSSKANEFRHDAGGRTWVFDTLTKTASYSLDTDPKIWWAGWNLFPLAQLDSAERGKVELRCKLPPGS